MGIKLLWPTKIEVEGLKSWYSKTLCHSNSNNQLAMIWSRLVKVWQFIFLWLDRQVICAEEILRTSYYEDMRAFLCWYTNWYRLGFNRKLVIYHLIWERETLFIFIFNMGIIRSHVKKKIWCKIGGKIRVLLKCPDLPGSTGPVRAASASLFLWVILTITSRALGTGTQSITESRKQIWQHLHSPLHCKQWRLWLAV